MKREEIIYVAILFLFFFQSGTRFTPKVDIKSFGYIKKKKQKKRVAIPQLGVFSPNQDE